MDILEEVAVAENRQRRSQQDLWDKTWKDKNGKVVIYQHPNPLLIAWVVVTVLSIFINGKLSTVLWWLAMALLAAWSLLEIFKGVNYFRRALGAVVLLLVILAVFKVGY